MNIAKTFLATLVVALLIGNITFAQDKKPAKKPETKTMATASTAEKPMIITVTTLHRSMDGKAGTRDEWKALEKEYFDKVTKKNDLVIGQEVLTHYFTADNTEILLVSMYRSWADIENAGIKEDELVKAAWPDEKARNAFFDKKNAYYANEHSDEILESYPFAKNRAVAFTKPMLYYVRKSHFAFPKDGTEKEFKELMAKYRDEVVNKNEFIKAYYPNVHAWGADKTEFTEVYVVDSLGDVEKMFDRDDELAMSVWPDEAKRKEYNDKFDHYFTGFHGDHIYQSVPELTK
jgi:signal peptidase I